jgi:hypothetical protein
MDFLGRDNSEVRFLFFQFNKVWYKQSDGLGMWSPISPLLADFFMNFLEEKISILPLFKNLVFYYRYVDDILGLWTGTKRQLDLFLTNLNIINDSIKFTMEVGGNSISFLDIRLNICNNKIEFDVFRKPTYSDNIIHATSNHHISHKLSVFHSLLHRLLEIPLSKENYNKEIKTIEVLAKNNGYPVNGIMKLLERKIKKRSAKLIAPGLTRIQTSDSEKWAKLHYIPRMSQKVSKIVKGNKNRIAFYNKNSLRKHLVNNKDRVDKLENGGVYVIVQ